MQVDTLILGALIALVLLLLDRRRSLHPGQLFGANVIGYPLGRVVLETMRTDEAQIVLGQRLNVWTSLVVVVIGAVIWVLAGRRAKGATGAPDAPEDRVETPSTTTG